MTYAEYGELEPGVMPVRRCAAAEGGSGHFSVVRATFRRGMPLLAHTATLSGGTVALVGSVSFPAIWTLLLADAIVHSFVVVYAVIDVSLPPWSVWGASAARTRNASSRRPAATSPS